LEVDGVEDALGAVDVRLDAGAGVLLAARQYGEQLPAAIGAAQPHGPVLKVVGGLWAAGRVAHADQRLAVRGDDDAREAQAQGFGLGRRTSIMETSDLCRVSRSHHCVVGSAAS
jgi:hypothetical protein